jgi:uracil-DNA glycosylase
MKTSTGHVEPSEGSIRACTKRVKEFIRLVKPGLIFRVGKLTHKNLSEKEVGIKMVNLPHPANLIRLDVSQKTLAIQRCVIAIEDAVNEFLIPF